MLTAEENDLLCRVEGDAPMGQMMRKMGKEMGEEMPPEFDEVVDRLESGQSPEDIEKSIPDLGGTDSAGGEED